MWMFLAHVIVFVYVIVFGYVIVFHSFIHSEHLYSAPSRNYSEALNIASSLYKQRNEQI
jgi:hypothetical protein